MSMRKMSGVDRIVCWIIAVIIVAAAAGWCSSYVWYTRLVVSPGSWRVNVEQSYGRISVACSTGGVILDDPIVLRHIRYSDIPMESTNYFPYWKWRDSTIIGYAHRSGTAYHSISLWIAHWAVIVAALLAAIAMSVRALMNNGSLLRCVKCDYDLRGSRGRDVCPECGSPITYGGRKRGAEKGSRVID